MTRNQLGGRVIPILPILAALVVVGLLPAAEPAAWRSDSLPEHAEITAELAVAGGWRPAQVLDAPVEHKGDHHIGFVRISASGALSLRLRHRVDAGQPVVRPARRNLTVVADGDGWRLDLPGPIQAVVEWPTRPHEPVAVFVDPPLAAPDPQTPGVWYLGPGTHRPATGPWLIQGGTDVLAPAAAEVVGPEDTGMRYAIEHTPHRSGPWTTAVAAEPPGFLRGAQRHALTTRAAWWRLRVTGVQPPKGRRSGTAIIHEFALLAADGTRLQAAEQFGATFGWQRACDGKPNTAWRADGCEAFYLPPWITEVFLHGDAVLHGGINAVLYNDLEALEAEEVHPDQALAQMQSTINFGQSACMWGEITVKNGAVEQNNFDMYRVARINEAPKVLDIHFIKSDSVPGGLGEPGTAVVQPAIGNAIFAACGKRCRVLPFTPENIRAS